MNPSPIHTVFDAPQAYQLYIIGSIGVVKFSNDTGNPLRRTLGGAGFNIGVAAAVNHVHPSIITTVSESDAKLLAKLQLDSICDTTHIKISPNYQLEFNYKSLAGKSEPNQLIEGFGHSAANYHIQACLSQTGWYHISCRDPLHPRPLINKLQSDDRNRISIDFTVSSIVRQFPVVRPMLQFVDLIFLNESEHEYLKNELLRVHYKGIVIVTRQERSAQAWYRDVRILDIQTTQTQPIDPSGAGDCFTGGFLANVSRGNTLADAIMAGHQTAHKSLSNIGVEALLEKRIF